MPKVGPTKTQGEFRHERASKNANAVQKQAQANARLQVKKAAGRNARATVNTGT